jgi:hypothetical protein
VALDAYWWSLIIVMEALSKVWQIRFQVPVKSIEMSKGQLIRKYILSTCAKLPHSHCHVTAALESLSVQYTFSTLSSSNLFHFLKSHAYIMVSCHYHQYLYENTTKRCRVLLLSSRLTPHWQKAWKKTYHSTVIWTTHKYLYLKSLHLHKMRSLPKLHLQ